jgi:hypothetical protein
LGREEDGDAGLALPWRELQPLGAACIVHPDHCHVPFGATVEQTNANGSAVNDLAICEAGLVHLKHHAHVPLRSRIAGCLVHRRA